MRAARLLRMAAAKAPEARPAPASMPHFRLHDSGDRMPAVGLGTFVGTRFTNTSPEGTTREQITKWLYAGGRAIDCAANYLNEDQIGDAISQCVADGIVKRDELFITSKLNNPYHRPENARQALEKTLFDLKLDQVDLYMMHWPTAFVNVPFDSTQRGFPMEYEPDQCSKVTGITWEQAKASGAWPPPHLDKGVSIHETWAAMVELKNAGLAKNIGVCNFNVMLLNELLTVTDTKPAVLSCESHPFLQQRGLIQFCNMNNIVFQSFSPLGYGAFAGSTEPRVLTNKTIESIAQKYNCHPAKVVLRWHIQRGTPTMPMTLHLNEMLSNLAVGDWELSAEDMEQIAQIDIRHRYLRPQDWYGLPLFD